MSAIDIFLAKGKKGLILEKDWLTRDEKDEVRARFGPEGSAGVWFLEVPDEDEPELTEDEVVDVGTHDDPDAQVIVPPNTPTIPDELEGLTVAQLKEIAETEEIDISDVKLKADIVGRIWGAREMRAEEQEG
jgi:hypothetical protein